MPRLRILELPMEHAGEYSRTPFVAIIDKVDDTATFTRHTQNDDMAKVLGAQGVLVFEDEIELEQ